jgi:serine/threonine protein kinase
MASFSKTEKSSIQQSMTANVYNGLLQMTIGIPKFESLPAPTGKNIETFTTVTSGYHSQFEGNPVVVKKIDLSQLIERNIQGVLITVEQQNNITTNILGNCHNEIVNYHEVSQLRASCFCKFVGYNIHYIEGDPLILSIVMDDCGDQDLFTYVDSLLLSDDAYYALTMLKYFFVKILKKLEILHDAGFVHGDIKLENIFFNSNTGEVLLGDAGSLTKIGATEYIVGSYGTPEYRDPNLARPIKNNEDLKGSDIYSLFVSINNFAKPLAKALYKTTSHVHFFDGIFGIHYTPTIFERADIEKSRYKYWQRNYFFNKEKYYTNDKWLNIVRFSDLKHRPTATELLVIIDNLSQDYSVLYAKYEENARKHQAFIHTISPTKSRRGGNRHQTLIKGRTQKTNKSRRRRRHH